MGDGLKNLVIVLLIIQIVLIGYTGYGSKLAYDKFNELQGSLNNFKTDTNNMITNINSKIGVVEEDFKKSASSLTSSIQNLEVENKKLDKSLKEVQIKSQDFSSIIEETLESVVSIQTNLGLGSGVIVSKEGYIITNHHVIDQINAGAVITYKKGNFPMRIVKKDPKLDLAVIAVEGVLKPLDFADSDLVKVGDRVIALGNPSGLSFSVTEGIISQINRELPGVPYGLFQTDVPINPGNSGGPIVGIEGKIIGINRLKIKGLEGLGFAIPSDVVKSFVTSAIAEDREMLEKIRQG